MHVALGTLVLKPLNLIQRSQQSWNPNLIMADAHENPAMDLVESEDCPIKQVDLTVPKTDDPTMPALTFRMWVLGIGACALLSFVNQFFWYRTEPLTVSSISAQIAVVPLGHLMARTITNRTFFKGKKWEFTLNPGPFNIKEHVLITIFANSGAGTVYATHVLTAVKLLYKRKLTFFPAFLLMITTQVSVSSFHIPQNMDNIICRSQLTTVQKYSAACQNCSWFHNILFTGLDLQILDSCDQKLINMLLVPYKH